MNSEEETVVVKARLAKAVYERDGWKASGIQEKYLEAYSLVEALELLLEQRDRAVRAKLDDTSMSSGSHDLLGELQLQISEGDLPDEVTQRARVMRQFSIGFNGRYYHYRGYRYDRLSDAVNYATLQQSRPSGDDSDYVGLADEQLRLPPQEIMPPGESDLRLMSALAITFHNGSYFLGPYRYDHLADAVRYARLVPH